MSVMSGPLVSGYGHQFMCVRAHVFVCLYVCVLCVRVRVHARVCAFVCVHAYVCVCYSVATASMIPEGLNCR